MKTVVIKVGGSLFDLPDLASRLSRLINEIENRHPLIVCGGGATANLVRSWDKTYHLGDETAHWLAIQSLMLNNRLLCEILSDACVVSSQREAMAVWKENRIPILCSYTYLKRTSETRISPLPASWDVTSDSIAAWVALTWPAEDLVLLKSVDLPLKMPLLELARTGLVDPYFPTFAESLPKLSWCNLRSQRESAQLTTVSNGKSFHIRNATGPA